MSDIVELDRRAVERSVEIVDAVTPAQLDLRTPCEQWSVRDLFAHMIAQHVGFASSAAGNTSDRSVWDVHPLGSDPAADYAAAARRVIAAFGEPGVLDREFWLPEIRGGGPFPAPMAISFHLVDYVVHGWDVAAALGVPADYDADLVDAATGVAIAVPDGPERRVPGAAFRPALATPGDASPMARLLALLGRPADWAGPSSAS